MFKILTQKIYEGNFICMETVFLLLEFFVGLVSENMVWAVIIMFVSFIISAKGKMNFLTVTCSILGTGIALTILSICGLWLYWALKTP